jgi:hypothetical protein
MTLLYHDACDLWIRRVTDSPRCHYSDLCRWCLLDEATEKLDEAFLELLNGSFALDDVLSIAVTSNEKDLVT